MTSYLSCSACRPVINRNAAHCHYGVTNIKYSQRATFRALMNPWPCTGHEHLTSLQSQLNQLIMNPWPCTCHEILASLQSHLEQRVMNQWPQCAKKTSDLIWPQCHRLSWLAHVVLLNESFQPKNQLYYFSILKFRAFLFLHANLM